MCANCGCGTPEDTQGDERNILWSQIVASAEANDITPTEAIQNMQKMAEQQKLTLEAIRTSRNGR